LRCLHFISEGGHNSPDTIFFTGFCAKEIVQDVACPDVHEAERVETVQNAVEARVVLFGLLLV